MNRKTVFLIAVVGASLTGLFAINSQSTTTAALKTADTQWEHLALTVAASNGVGDAEASGQIVRLGNDGWELVGVESLVKEGTTTKLAYFFKRPK